MCIETSMQPKLSFPGTQPHVRFSCACVFSVTSIALNDVDERGGNVIKPFVREIGSDQKFVSL